VHYIREKVLEFSSTVLFAPSPFRELSKYSKVKINFYKTCDKNDY